MDDALVFMTLCVKSGDRQIEADGGKREKPSFISHQGLYFSTEMPFGLKRALSTFERAMDVVLSPHQVAIHIFNLYNIVHFSKTLREHIYYTRPNFHFLKGARIILKFIKCTFLTNKTESLRHTVRPGKIEVAK